MASEPSSANSSLAPSDRGEGTPHQPLQQQPGAAYQQRPSSATPPVMAGTPSQPGDHGVLLSRLRAQVEFYFSSQNLARDTYLRNMLTAKHQEMASPQPARLMTPIGVITNFPKVRDICSSFARSLPEPPQLLLARALEGSTIVTISPDAAWIGPASQQLPPMGMMGGPPLRAPPPQSHFQPGPYPPSNIHPQRMMMGQGPPVPHTVQGDVVAQIVHQPMQYSGSTHDPTPPSLGSESPSSNSLESTPSQTKEVVFVAVMDLPECDPLEILSAFATETVRPIAASVDGNNVWYISFGSEKEAKSALLGSSEKTIAGAPIRAILKSDLPSSKVSVASASGASISSMSETQQRLIPIPGVPPGAGPQMIQPVPMHGGGMGPPPQGTFPLPQLAVTGPQPPPGSVGNSSTPREMYPPQNTMPAAGGPHFPGPYYLMPPYQMAGIPGQQFPPYYNPQHMQQMYPYYMQQQGQQYVQPYPHPSPHHMGARYVGGVPPPPPPRYSGPGGMSHMPYQHQGMPHYAGQGEGYGHYHGHPPPRQPGLGRGTSSGSGNSDGGYKKKMDQGMKNKKNKKHQKRDSVASGGGGSDSDHLRGKPNDYHHGQMHSYREDSSTPHAMHGDHRGKRGQRRGEYGDQQLRRSYGASSPSFNRHQRHNNNRLSSSATSPTRENNMDGNREIFSAADFPGLGGTEKPVEKPQHKSNHVVVRGYADALLKKSGKDAEKSTEDSTAKETDYDADSITRQTEAMEKEILSEFHDLSIRGGVVEVPECPVPHRNDTIEGMGVISQHDTGATTSNESSGETPKNSKMYDLPILPGSFPEYDVNESQSNDSMGKSVNDNANCAPFFSAELKVDVPLADHTPAPFIGEETAPELKAADKLSDQPKPSGVWGSKRLFSDVLK